MTDKDQIDHFANDVDKLVERYRSEYDLTYAAVIGTLEIKIQQLCREAWDSTEEDED